MTIETQHSINDTVFFLVGREVVNGLVTAINTIVNLNSNITNTYGIQGQNYNIGEKYVFKTKEELIKSL